MTATIQIKDIPDDLHRQIKARAECEGISVPQLILREVRNSLDHTSTGVMPPSPECPPLKEILQRHVAQPVRHLSPSPTEMLREDRDSPPISRQIPGAAEGILKGIKVNRRFSDRDSLMSNFE